MIFGTIVVQWSPNNFWPKFCMWRHYFCWRHHFRLDVIIWEYIYNFRLNDANDFIFTPRLNIDKRNIFWDFGENPTWWRHFTSRDFIFLHFYVTWRKMTSSWRIFTKISEYVSFVNMKSWCKYEVICII